jgi:hypothetical protein
MRLKKMAKKKNVPMKNVESKTYECPGCHTNYGFLPPCPKCMMEFQIGIYPKQMTEIKAFLKKNPLNKVELYYFGEALCYEFKAYKKPAPKKTK